ncbi:chromosome segregation protein SMC [Morganella morganii]|uniref:Chromosome segregation protein SMC n=1 Tax=Morganella morganii TaxID=582 RepID=A0A0D8L5P5_MORMO|nr:AAA family ATPase [Morganella morganii]KJF77122.1 chromosome segregation protein SMC [Morganella morganii]
MKIRKISLTNFRGIQKADITFTDRLTVIVGVNGAGKTTLLDALAITLSQVTSRIYESAQKARSFSPDDIFISADYTRAVVGMELEQQTIEFALALNKRAAKHPKERSSDFDLLNSVIQPLAAKNKNYRENEATAISLPLAIYYDVHRAVMDIPLRVREKLKNTPAEGNEDALTNGGADFKRFFNWYRNEEDRENQNIRRDHSYTDPKLDAVRSAIETFTGFCDLHIDRKTPLRMVVRKKDLEFSVNQLSNGEKCLLALVGDLARRLALVNPLSSNPLLGDAIVLIDEIDLHLHPKWQRNILKNFAETFPNCQFIVSTHSPQIIGEIPPENVLLVRDGNILGNPSSARGLSSNEVLELIMEGDARNPEIKQQIENIEASLDDDYIEKARHQLAQLKKQIGSTPDVMRLDSSIETLDFLLNGDNE